MKEKTPEWLPSGVISGRLACQSSKFWEETVSWVPLIPDKLLSVDPETLKYMRWNCYTYLENEKDF